ncbi:MAG TPA: stage 0 sporulation family protein [Chloroflexi bacterium]|nr:stage 0 sporulation family protein [Chloroflexota bacterium]
MRFHPTGKLYDFDACNFPDLRDGDFVVVETARGQQLGQVIRLRLASSGRKAGKGLKPVVRLATGADMIRRQRWRDLEQQALTFVRQVSRRMGLPIKLALAEYAFDGSHLTVLYTSEEKKLNLEPLKGELQEVFDVPVEIRRIGPRDFARLMGGYGACGEPRCCARFMSEFVPVAIKMAKLQGVSLNPADITGMCGRLRCCLAYEYELYQEACKLMPRRKKRVQTPYGKGKVIDLLPLKGVVVVQLEDDRVEVPVEEVELISS